MNDAALNVVSWYTDLGQVALPVVAGLYTVHKKDYTGTGWLLLSVVINQICIDTLKKVIGGKRPNGKEGAFPSGNTASAFLGPCFLMARYGLLPANALVFSSLVSATLVGIGRVLINVHWPRDIVGGALLGYAVSRIVPMSR